MKKIIILNVRLNDVVSVAKILYKLINDILIN